MHHSTASGLHRAFSRHEQAERQRMSRLDYLSQPRPKRGRPTKVAKKPVEPAKPIKGGCKDFGGSADRFSTSFFGH